MKIITITPKDIETDSSLISELAGASKQWTEYDLWENNFEYEPDEPYDYDYETDLFEHTKNARDLYILATTLEISLNANWERLAKEQKLQAGACVALNNQEQWDELLKAHKEKLQTERTDGISESYNKELQESIDSYQEDLYREWLYGGRERDNNGVIYEISKYFTSNTNGQYDEKTGSYTFVLDEDDIQNYKDIGYKASQFKRALIDDIKTAIINVRTNSKLEQEKMKAERDRMKAYKAERAQQEAEERKAKLLSMKLK